MNNRPEPKNYAQAGLQAHQEMHDWLNDPNPEPMTHPAFDEEASRARHLLHRDGEMGHSSFRAGETLLGPKVDECLPTLMEKKLER